MRFVGDTDGRETNARQKRAAARAERWRKAERRKAEQSRATRRQRNQRKAEKGSDTCRQVEKGGEEKGGAKSRAHRGPPASNPRREGHPSAGRQLRTPSCGRKGSGSRRPPMELRCGSRSSGLAAPCNVAAPPRSASMCSSHLQLFHRMLRRSAHVQTVKGRQVAQTCRPQDRSETSRVDQHVAIGIGAEAVSPPGSRRKCARECPPREVHGEGEQQGSKHGSRTLGRGERRRGRERSIAGA